MEVSGKLSTLQVFNSVVDLSYHCLVGSVIYKVEAVTHPIFNHGEGQGSIGLKDIRKEEVNV